MSRNNRTNSLIMWSVVLGDFLLLLIARLVERNIVKHLRRLGMNTRTVTFVGNDPELRKVFDIVVSIIALAFVGVLFPFIYLIIKIQSLGPRPHMLAHTAMYSELIDKYMVRHFVKPGVTGWAQVTGYRGETKELWQMEGRVTRDIWYLEHWSFWLDLRIVWLTMKTIFVPDKNAY